MSGLSVSFAQKGEGTFQALKDVSLSIGSGERVAIVGESGSGKTVLARAILGLLPPGTVYPKEAVRWRGEAMSGFSGKRWRAWRSKSVAVIWQNPQGSFVPVYSIGRQMHWALRLQGVAGRGEREQRMRELFSKVGLVEPERIARQYPEQLSGGECQRVMIAMALARRPALLVADEPTSNLDVKLQAEIVGLIENLASELGLALLFITHDLALATRISTRTIVLHRGAIVEEGPTEEIFRHPRAEYTRTLVESVAPSASTKPQI